MKNLYIYLLLFITACSSEPYIDPDDVDTITTPGITKDSFSISYTGRLYHINNQTPYRTQTRGPSDPNYSKVMELLIQDYKRHAYLSVSYAFSDKSFIQNPSPIKFEVFAKCGANNHIYQLKPGKNSSTSGYSLTISQSDTFPLITPEYYFQGVETLFADCTYYGVASQPRNGGGVRYKVPSIKSYVD